MASGISRADTMKALYLTNWCEPGTVADSVLFGEVRAPTKLPVKNEVLIEVRASAVNVDDIALCQDTAGGGWYFHGRRPTADKPYVGGCEYSGVVLEVGPQVTGLKIGDRVCGVQDIAMQKNPGTWAEQTLAPEKDVVRIPAECDISFVEAAASGMAAFVAGDMYRRAKLSSDYASRCLVVGASGGLGTFMLQLLNKHKGIPPHVVAVCSGANTGMVRRLGASDVVNYEIAPFGKQLEGGDKFDVVFDFVGGTETEHGAAQVLKRGGKFITAVGPMQGLGDRLLSWCDWHSWACGLLYRVMKSSCCCSNNGCCCTCSSSFTYELGGGMPPLKADDFITTVVEAGARAQIAMEVPFEEDSLRAALRRVASRHPGGKVVINMERRARR